MLFDKNKKCICSVFASINILIMELQWFSNVRFLLKIKKYDCFLDFIDEKERNFEFD